MDSALVYSLLAACVVSAMSLGGIIFVHRQGLRLFARYHHHFLAFSVGVLLVILYTLAEESVHVAEHSARTLILGALLGASALFLASRIHHHHHHEAHDGHSHSRSEGHTVLVADGVHNISDGLILYPAFLVSPLTGFVATIGIALHELVSEIAEFFILKEAGYTTREALLRNALTATSIFVGVLLAFSLSTIEGVEAWIRSVSLGAFAYLIFVDLIPCVYGHTQKNATYQYIIATLCGAVLMLCVGWIFPHEH